MKSKLAILLMIACTGCVGPQTYSEGLLKDFNSDFNKQNPLQPKYAIDKVGVGKYSLTLHQGTVMWAEGDIRYSILKQAAETVGSNLCIKLGAVPEFGEWSKQGDAGWVHLMVSVTCIAVGHTTPERQVKPEKKDDPI